MSEWQNSQTQAGRDGIVCVPTLDEHCVTCSDEALPAIVLRIDPARGCALVSLNNTTTEVDITLVNGILPGEQLLVHGGVALARIQGENHERYGGI